MELEQQVVLKRKGGYDAIHKWLKSHYGKAYKCESHDCKSKSKNFQWAKIKDKVYIHTRTSFMMLCASCHRKYDMTDELKNKISKSKLGTKFSKKHRLSISRSMKGKNIGNTNAKKYGIK